jgi:hypothetical protein
MLNREDVERIVKNVLSELTLDIESGDFTSPNSRTVILKLGDRLIAQAHFDVVQAQEYEG